MNVRGKSLHGSSRTFESTFSFSDTYRKHAAYSNGQHETIQNGALRCCAARMRHDATQPDPTRDAVPHRKEERGREGGRERESFFSELLSMLDPGRGRARATAGSRPASCTYRACLVERRSALTNEICRAKEGRAMLLIHRDVPYYTRILLLLLTAARPRERGLSRGREPGISTRSAATAPEGGFGAPPQRETGSDRKKAARLGRDVPARSRPTARPGGAQPSAGRPKVPFGRSPHQNRSPQTRPVAGSRTSLPGASSTRPSPKPGAPARSASTAPVPK